MATASFSIFYKARVVKAIVAHTRNLYAFGVTTTGRVTVAPTSATCNVVPTATVLGRIAHGSIPFANLPTIHAVTGAEISNSGASAQLTIPAGRVVHYIGLADGSGTHAVLLTYVKLTRPDIDYYYQEQGTLTVPMGGYTVRHA